MHRWILSSVLAGTAALATGQAVQRPLSVTATVTDSCLVTSNPAVPAHCTRGTSWTREPAARAETRPAPAATSDRTSSAGTRYVTISY